MLSSADRQEQFAAAILDAGRPIPIGLWTPPGADRQERFAVYRNNVAVGLIEALRSSYPVVDRLVGGAFFTAMARMHALAHPPRSPVLLDYGGDFPAFVAAFEPASALPYLADVARLEWAWLEAYHAADAVALTIEDIRGIPAEAALHLRLTLHPSVRALAFTHPALTIWRGHQGQNDPAELSIDDDAEHVLVARPEADVATMILSAGELRFLDAITLGGTLTDATEAAVAAQSGIDIGDLLARLFGIGAFAGFSIAAPPIPGESR
ncbi:MAG: putative DNA-binding domain-containing protein [Caulobacter sp.]|nr:putative DNA-binding domain-containing protein [Caulobacter sp.]